MRACIQRVTQASVVVSDQTVGQIGSGLLVLLGVGSEDTEKEAAWLAHKIATLRIFEDGAGKMNLSVLDTGGEMLVVSQFTLYGECHKGRRPSFVNAAPPLLANQLYEKFVAHTQELNINTATGIFRTDMQVSLTNDGPVTLWIDTAERGVR